MMEPMTLLVVQLSISYDRSGWNYQIIEPSMMAFFRPKISEINPEKIAESHDPPAIEAVIPP